MPCIVGFNCESWKRRPPARFLGSIINTPKRVDGCLSLKDSAFDQQRRDNTGLEIDPKNVSIWIFAPKTKYQLCKYLDFGAKNLILIGFSQQIIRQKITCLFWKIWIFAPKRFQNVTFVMIFEQCVMQLHTSDNYCFVWKWQELWKIFRIDELADSLYLQQTTSVPWNFRHVWVVLYRILDQFLKLNLRSI